MGHPGTVLTEDAYPDGIDFEASVLAFYASGMNAQLDTLRGRGGWRPGDHKPDGVALLGQNLELPLLVQNPKMLVRNQVKRNLLY